MAKIISLPARHVAEAAIRFARNSVAHLEHIAETGGISAGSIFEEAAKQSGWRSLPDALERLAKAEATLSLFDADDALHHKGMVFRAYPSIAGAN